MFLGYPIRGPPATPIATDVTMGSEFAPHLKRQWGRSLIGKTPVPAHRELRVRVPPPPLPVTASIHGSRGY